MFTITSEADPSGNGSLALMALAVLLAGCCVLSSVLLLVGLCVDCPNMLIPWIGFVSVTTILEFIILFYMIGDTIVDAVRASFLAVDLVVCALSVYSILCVVSQYQQYKQNQRGSQRGSGAVDTTVKYYPSSSDLVNGSTQSSVVPHHQQPKVVIEVSPTTTHSCPTNHLLGSATPSATSSSFSRPSAADVTSVSDRSPSPPTLPTTLSAKPDAVTAVKRVRTISQHSLAEDSPDASPEHVRSEREPLLEAVPSSRKCYREGFLRSQAKGDIFAFRKTNVDSLSGSVPVAASGNADSNPETAPGCT